MILLGAVIMVLSLGLVAAPAASAEWLPEGWSTEGEVFRNSTNGDIELWSKAGYVTRMTASEFEQYSKIVEAYGKIINDPSTVASTLSQDAINATQGITAVEAQDAVDVTLAARAGTLGGSLSSTIAGGLTSAGADAGVWGTSSLGAAGAAMFGIAALGSSAFLVGGLIGNEISQIFGWPSLEEWLAAGNGPIKETSGYVIEEGIKTVEGSTSPPLPRGLYHACFSTATSYEEKIVEFPSEPSRVGTTSWGGCEHGAGYAGTTVVKEFHGPYEKTEARAYWFEVCKVPEGQTTCPVEIPPVPVGVPVPAPVEVITEPYRKHDVERGFGEKPERKIATPPQRSVVLSPEEVQRILTHGMQAPSTRPTQAEMNEAAEGKTTEHPTAAPTYNYFLTKSSQPPTQTGTSAPPAEPEAPPTVGPTIPAIKFPEINTPCNRFPFGIPCWLVARLSEFATGEKTPKFEPEIYGHKMVIDFKRADQLMEIVRAVELVLGVIGVVLLFGRFASSPTGSSGSGD